MAFNTSAYDHVKSSADICFPTRITIGRDGDTDQYYDQVVQQDVLHHFGHEHVIEAIHHHQLKQIIWLKNFDQLEDQLRNLRLPSILLKRWHQGHHDQEYEWHLSR